MRIDSSTIGMESARKHTTLTGRVSKLMITTGRQSLKDGTGSLLKDTESDVKDQEKQTKENKGNSLQNTLEEMRAKTGNAGLSRINSTELRSIQEQLMEIRQQCLNYLMRIFFPEKKK